MADQYYLDLLTQGVNAWNQWRQDHSEIQPDLSGASLPGFDLNRANLSKANLRGVHFRGDYPHGDLNQANVIVAEHVATHFNRTSLIEAYLNETDPYSLMLMREYLGGADLSEANLSEANLNGADLIGADLSRANLSGANLFGAYLNGANLSGPNLSGANLFGADLFGANLSGANMRRVNLSAANLSGADCSGADLTGCSIYAISAWDVKLVGAVQSNLIITTPYGSNEPVITVDNLEVAQFIYLLLNNTKIRDVIDTIASKVVLILGRFTPERKAVLDALRDELRKQNYSPVLFDFEKPASRDLTETVSTLAHLARFIIVDLTDPSSAPHEVATVIPHTVVPVQPLLLQEPLMVDGKAVERREYAMFEDLRHRYRWVLPTFRYQDTAELLGSIQAYIIASAEQKARELTQPK